ncbi:MAG TPA: ABC transporter permease [Acetomicrobium flavidum]|uniref:Permease component of ribose/xylose/arabinose/galactoside ABC-type transporters n=1 Tax=Acetomicrobium mobile (strain ATCC BAA-54 / DSM 13181 / JCM 12221 / NGA) TaxID=891968 RepID=I4BU68_ACEMN|nr:ABC transporter permease [Acetomicrobium mobile]AFM20825.1 permease component of ribose/xylose/arabinose/galactoside ABC-type transporters [Acetomicrobium mobile DSM 13181]HPU69558.1 ABC transporter permease [Acetomicrobium flavidum]
MKKREATFNLKRFLMANIVPIIFILLSAFAIPISQFSAPYLVQEMLIRLARDSFLVLSLLVPIIAGMGLNFGMVLGAMAGQIGLILVSDWKVMGLPGMTLAAIIATPLAVALGWMCGAILNRAKGREMVTSYILGFFVNGLYQLVVLYFFGSLIPIHSPELVLSRGYGIRNAVNLVGIRNCLDYLIPVTIHGIRVPLGTFIIIAAFSAFIVWFRKTKLGQDMRAVGQDMEVSRSAGIPVERTRLISIVISTVLAAYGQIIFLQNIGTLNTYNSHEQAGMFAIAALLIGGASVAKATLPNVFVGVILFHLMFIVSPMAGKYLIGQAQLGEYFRVFVSYGVVALALVIYEWRRAQEKAYARRMFRGEA